MPSRQERRKAERDAAKRTPAQAGAAGARGAATAPTNANVETGGDWTTQNGDYKVLLRALGIQRVTQKAAEGDMEAQFSQGYNLMSGAAAGGGAAGGPLGAAGRSPMADVGLALRTAHFPLAQQLRRVDAVA
jgi:hypothetical protein